MGGIGYFSILPAYEHLAADQAMIKLAFTHAGQHVEECRKQSAEEQAKLPTNRRKLDVCKRERVPIQLELALDGAPVFSGSQPAAGLWKDGPSHVYARFPVPAGTHTLSARLRDSRRQDGGYDYEATREVVLRPGQNFVIGFRTETGGFTFE
jgi:hypothetical protein